jgi:hypothetical protein
VIRQIVLYYTIFVDSIAPFLFFVCSDVVQHNFHKYRLCNYPIMILLMFCQQQLAPKLGVY